MFSAQAKTLVLILELLERSFTETAALGRQGVIRLSGRLRVKITKELNMTNFFRIAIAVEIIQKPVQVSQNHFFDNRTFVQPGDMFIHKFVADEKSGECKFNTSPIFFFQKFNYLIYFSIKIRQN